jgi:hypothetical protein
MGVACPAMRSSIGLGSADALKSGFYLVAASLLLWTLFISIGFVKGHQIRRLPLCLTPMYCLVSLRVPNAERRRFVEPNLEFSDL